jgi:hypothetical protein
MGSTALAWEIQRLSKPAASAHRATSRASSTDAMATPPARPQRTPMRSPAIRIPALGWSPGRRRLPGSGGTERRGPVPVGPARVGPAPAGGARACGWSPGHDRTAGGCARTDAPRPGMRPPGSGVGAVGHEAGADLGVGRRGQVGAARARTWSMAARATTSGGQEDARPVPPPVGVALGPHVARPSVSSAGPCGPPGPRTRRTAARRASPSPRPAPAARRRAGVRPGLPASPARAVVARRRQGRHQLGRRGRRGGADHGGQQRHHDGAQEALSWSVVRGSRRR